MWIVPDVGMTASPVTVWMHDENSVVVEVAASFAASIHGLRLEPDAI
jgi:hypothetical protein